mgnify:CR=1 FL=1
MKIKRMLREGEIGDVKTTDELLETAGTLLDKSEAHEILGSEVVFEGEDGKFYVCTIEAVIGEAHPDYLKQVLTEIAEEEDDA